MAVQIKQDYERKKAKKEPVKKDGTVKVKKKSAPEPETKKASTVLFILQDPESRDFSDTIKLGGREIVRECVRGTLKTEDVSLKDFLVGKGWYLIHETLLPV